MKQSFIFKAHHIPTDTNYWFDVMWGNMYGIGSGYIGMLPIEQTERKIKSFTNADDRIPIDPYDCEITIYEKH